MPLIQKKTILKDFENHKLKYTMKYDFFNKFIYSFELIIQLFIFCGLINICMLTMAWIFFESSSFPSLEIIDLNITPKHGFHDYDNLQLLFNYSHVVIFELWLLSFARTIIRTT
jgi:hypothetical protein